MEILDSANSNQTWTYENVSEVQLELSSRCNAACPGCVRFVMNSPIVSPWITQTDVTIEQFKQWFPVEFVSRVQSWIICGTHGDPMACKDIYEILEYICKYSTGKIQVNTNAGLGNVKLYTKIGKLFAKYNRPTLWQKIIDWSLKKPRTERVVIFSIDGLKDTNHIYRRNVQWNKVWENLMAYVATGALTYWDFLQFKHNVHQIKEARALAKQHKIVFILKNPFGVNKTAMPAYNKNLQLDYVIEHATDNGYPAYFPAGPGYVAPMPEKITASGCIDCYSLKRNNDNLTTTIYVDAQGRVLPCCFVAVGSVSKVFDYGTQIQQIQSNMGTANSLDHYTLKEILNNGVLDVWSNSWKDKSVAVCWQYCGRAEEKNRTIDNLWPKDE